MPSVFDRMFKQSGFPVLLQQNGEPVVYRPRAGGRRTIKAIIQRDPPAIYNAAGEVVLPEFILRVQQCSKTGIMPSEIDAGDSFELLSDFGDVAKTTYSVMKIVSQDGGVLTLALR